MANLPESDTAFPAVYQIETTDPVIGGPPNPSTGAGMSNIPHLQLAQRTAWLKKFVESLTLANVADTAQRLAMTAAERVKLSGIASGATKNATDAQLRDRATHTGSQAQSTVTGLVDALAGKAPAAHTHTIAQVANLQATLNGKADEAALTSLLEIAWTNQNSPRDFGGPEWSFRFGANGLILKVGTVSFGTGISTYTFQEPFPTSCRAVFLQDRTTDATPSQAHRLSVLTDTLSAASFQALVVLGSSDVEASTVAFWLAFGN